jgi:hypothetical protein
MSSSRSESVSSPLGALAFSIEENTEVPFELADTGLATLSPAACITPRLCRDSRTASWSSAKAAMLHLPIARIAMAVNVARFFFIVCPTCQFDRATLDRRCFS